MLRATLVVLLLTVSSDLLRGAKAQYEPHCDNKRVIVQLFEWKWIDIADECERFLGPAGYCAVQVSPPTEHVILPADSYPWWQRYEPVSYALYSRSGTPQEFANMVRRCNAVGVRTYVEAVINNMAKVGRVGESYPASAFNSSALDFPAVPYNAQHFTPREKCPSFSGDVDNNGDPNNVRDCFLDGLTDLYGELPYVRDTITGYLNHLVSLGVAGIRIHAAKHMWPHDISKIIGPVDHLPTDQGFPVLSKLFVYSDVTDRNDGAVKVDEYYDIGLVTEYRYSQKVAQGIIGNYDALTDIPDNNLGMARANRAFVFVDNHDIQRTGGSVITHKTPREYKQAVAFMLAHDYGFTQVMSSYYFDDSNAGPPHNADGTTADVIFNQDGSCDGGWVCEHRWNVIAKMVEFRNKVKDAGISNYFNANGVIGFSRGNNGYFLMTKSGSFNGRIQTRLPAGEFCNIIDGCATKVKVGIFGDADLSFNNYEEPIFAICVDCSADPIPTVQPPPRPTTTTTPTTTTPTTTTPTTTTPTTTTTQAPTTSTTTFQPPTVPCVAEGCPTSSFRLSN